MIPPTRFVNLPVLLLAVLPATWAGCAAQKTVIAQDGVVVKAPENLRDFRPFQIEPAPVPGLFEELGEEAAQWYQHVLTLSNSFFEGRASGTRGGKLSAEYVQFHFDRSGLPPAFDDGTSFMQPFSFAHATAHDEAGLHTQNVAAVLPGRGDLAGEWIIVGAHYDHVGYGYTGTRRPTKGQLHAGADDNASGIASLLLLAERLVERYAQDERSARSVLFVAFGAEEAGLHGSSYLVEHLPVPADRVMAMINMDMVGRLRNDNLYVAGTGTAREFDHLLRPIFTDSGLLISESRGGHGPSDHMNFYRAGIPVLFLFTGIHDAYHTPQDVGHTVHVVGGMRVLDLLERITVALAVQPAQLTFVASP